MLSFRLWLETWFPLRDTEKIHNQDHEPQTTPQGYVLYHGTNMAAARKIFKERRLLHDDLGAVGVATHPSRADVFGAMKARKGNPSVVLRLVIDKEWLDQQDITRESGGSNRDQFLIRVKEVPPLAIKDIQLARVSGTPLKGGNLEYELPNLP